MTYLEPFQSDAVDSILSSTSERAETVVITDPPYGDVGKWRHKGHMKDPVLTESYKEKLAKAFHLKASAVFIFCDIRQVSSWEKILKNSGFKYCRIGVWVKSHSNWAPSPYTSSSLEGFVWACSDRKDHNSGACILPAYKCSNGGACKEGEERHPFRKPVALIRQIIRDISASGKTIIDPFSGGGSIPVAALLEECHVIASDIDPMVISNLAWKAKNYYMWETSQPREDIRMSEDNNSEGKKPPPKKRKKSGWTDGERMHIIKALAEHTKAVNAKRKGTREFLFLQSMLGKDFNRAPSDLKGKKRAYGKINRRVSEIDLWKEVKAIIGEAKKNDFVLLSPQMSSSQRKASDIRRVLFASGVLKEGDRKRDQQGLEL